MKSCTTCLVMETAETTTFDAQEAGGEDAGDHRQPLQTKGSDNKDEERRPTTHLVRRTAAFAVHLGHG